MKHIGLLRTMLVVLVLLFSAKAILCQNLNIDSIKNIIRTDKPDTNNVRHLLDLAWELSFSNSDTAIKIASKALSLANQLKWNTGIAASNHDLGSFYGDIGNNTASIHHNQLALEKYYLMESTSKDSVKAYLNDKIANTLSNTGLVYSNQGSYPKALEYYLKALKIAQFYKNEKQQTIVLGNMGIVYGYVDEYDKSLSYYKMALDLAKKNNDEQSAMYNQFNIATVYYHLGGGNISDSLKKYYNDYALKNFIEVLRICEKEEHAMSRSTVLSNIGLVYDDTDRSEKALEYYFMALQLDLMHENLNNQTRVYGNIGLSYTKLKKYELAEKFLLRSSELADSLKLLNEMMQGENYLYDLYLNKGDYKKALQHYKLYSHYKDSIFNEDKNKELTKHELTFEFEKKEATLKAEQDKKEAVALADKKRQTIFFWLIASIAIAIGLIAIVIFRSLRLTRKQKHVIESQKELVEEKQREILDSIHYARRIQQSLLPTEKYIQKQLFRLKK